MPTKSDAVPLGAILQRARGWRDMTPRDLARAAGITVRYLNNIERDHKTPSLAVFKRLCLALHVSADVLLGMKEVP